MRTTRADAYDGVEVARRIVEPMRGARHLLAAPTVIRFGARGDGERGEDQ
jgi:hypothetical protein